MDNHSNRMAVDASGELHIVTRQRRMVAMLTELRDQGNPTTYPFVPILHYKLEAYINRAV